LENFDVVAAAGGPDRAVVREFRGVPATDRLEIQLTPAPGSRAETLLCGVEAVME